MTGSASSFRLLRWVLALLLGLLWTTMDGTAALAERGDFARSSFAARGGERLFSTVGGSRMAPALLSRIQTAFDQTPGRVMGSNAASKLHLGPNLLIEGETLSKDVIALRMNPSTSSVYEELIHTAQIRRGMTNVPQMEIVAAQKLVRFADAYKIPASETAATVGRLRILQGAR